ncbi:hypothetical protein LR48_Vigan07g040500 [Vigna angularis]|uniref:Uncharacterized protein n=1 Tax=Phaseolus angularis TaxID=3914 RepID=A0A0L9UVD8_PHAAN|nr:hypothetical protein LR48_Vigan07g040500 [Vigna angularis]
MPPKGKGKGNDAPKSKSPNKRKKNTKDTATSRVSENQPIIDPFHDLLNPSPSHNEYLEDAMFLRKPRIEEPEIPDVPLLLPPGYEERPRSFGGLEEIVESAKRLNRRKD